MESKFRVMDMQSSMGKANDTSQAFKRRKSGKHQMSACISCKRRRRKCDGKYPSCSNCIRFGEECTMVYPPTGKEIKRDYLEQLESKIKELEGKLDGNRSVSSSIVPTDLHEDHSDGISPLSTISSSTRSSLSVKYPPTSNRKTELADQVGYITLGASGETFYIGESSAYSFAKIIGSSFNYCPMSGKNSNINTNTHNDLPFKPPNINYANNLLISYKNTVQCQYPFLDWKYIEKCFNSVMLNNSKNDLENFFIYMIFAISTQIIDDNSRQYSKSYYNKALEYSNIIFNSINITTVQAFLLMAIFSQKAPDGVSCWQSIGLAIRTAVVLGLHRKPYIKKNQILNEFQILEQDLKSRIFWSAYGIERINGLILGRPFSISDIDIDTPFPLEIEENKVACHVVKLRTIQSSICTFIYKPITLLENEDNLESTRFEILLELNSWLKTYPCIENAISTFETKNWFIISYHNSILLLLRPVILEISKLKDKSPKNYLEWFKVFTESASAICLNYKDIYTKKKLSYTWLAMQCCFVSGISFLYCIWLDCSLNILKWKRKSLVFETINACQTLLYIFAERWDSAQRFRDSFETLSNFVTSYIENGDNIGEDNNDTNNITNINTTINKTDELSIENQFLNTGLFVDGSIEIDTYLTGKSLHDNFGKNENKHIDRNNDIHLRSNKEKDTHLWEFLDSVGDKYLRDLFVEMEDSFNYK